MITSIKSAVKDFSHLIFPHNCEGCGSDVLQNDQMLCSTCLLQLPSTNFISYNNNAVEKIFYGRLQLQNAAAAFYFSKQSLVQHLLHQLKYKGNKNIGLYLGNLMGLQLLNTSRFNDVDIIVPLPLNEKRESKRGYNQANIIAQGIAQVWQKPICNNAVVRKIFTETQTQHSRVHRWQNMDGVFAIANAQALQGKHILLVDDIITTGATLESCGVLISKLPQTTLSILATAYTTQ